MSDDDKVKPIGVRFKERPTEGDPMLRIVEARYGSGACDHRHYFDGNPLLGGARLREAQYLIREGETEVECGQCGTRLDPMFVLKILARQETQYDRSRERYQAEMKRLSERSRTKCQHCGKMTRISRK